MKEESFHIHLTEELIDLINDGMKIGYKPENSRVWFILEK